jgi:FkbM family methyltransferase
MAASIPRLKRLLAAARIVAIDIGARGGFTRDLAPIAAAVDATGFEPDSEECDRLNESARTHTLGYRALLYTPTAVGQPGAARPFNLYQRRGCSSLLTGDVEIAKQYAREHFFVLDEQIPVTVEGMDDAAARLQLTDAAYMKIDAQGAELEILRSAPKLVGDSLLCIRTEVQFAPLYKDQPLFADIDAELRGKGFMFMGFPELHAWRRGTESKPDRWNGGPTPMSEPQLIHGDALYLRSPDLLATETIADYDRLINYALLAIAYGQLDIAASVLTRPRIAQRVLEISALETSVLVRDLGTWHARRRRAAMGKAALKQWRDFLRLAAR